MADDHAQDLSETGSPQDPPTAGAGSGGEGGTPPTFADFKTFLATQPAEIADLYDQEVAGLKGAYKATQDKLKQSSAQLRELAKTADPATAEALRKAAEEKDAENEALRNELNFKTAAVNHGLKGSVLDTAWALAGATGMTAEQMKANPDLAHWFQTPGAPRVSAGTGNNDKPGTKEDFNSIIRRVVNVQSGE